MTAFRRFVQVGRIVLINFGADAGKLAVIVDIADQNRVLVHAPTADPATAVARHIINVARISLTDLTINITRGARTAKILKEWAATDVDAKWAASSWGAKLARQAAKAKMTDLDRFSAMLTRKAASKKVRAALGK